MRGSFPTPLCPGGTWGSSTGMASHSWGQERSTSHHGLSVPRLYLTARLGAKKKKKATMLERRFQVWGNLILVLVHRLTRVPKLQLSQFQWKKSGQGGLLWKWAVRWVPVPGTQEWNTLNVPGGTLMMSISGLCSWKCSAVQTLIKRSVWAKPSLGGGWGVIQKLLDHLSGDTNAFCLHACVHKITMKRN